MLVLKKRTYSEICNVGDFLKLNLLDDLSIKDCKLKSMIRLLL